MKTDRTDLERAARERFEQRAARLQGHKIGAWESLSVLMREELISREHHAAAGGDHAQGGMADTELSK